MKNFHLVLIALLLFLGGCFISKEYPVEYDYNFLGDFDNYNSFDFFITPKNMDENHIKLVKSTIKSHLELLGYDFNPENPSFYVNFLYLNDSLRYRGYKQPKMENFVFFKNKKQKEREEYLKKDLSITNGTLVINFTETSQYAMIWQGYTTDLYSDYIFDDPRKVRVAVLSILNNYAFVPEKRKNN